MRHNSYDIDFDYAHRREFHRPFWDALRALRQRTFARIIRVPSAERRALRVG